MTAPEWRDARELFAPDGAVRLIVVDDLDLSLWRRYYAFLHKTEARLRLSLDGIEAAAPATFEPAWFTPGHRALLLITLADVTFSCRLETPQTMRIEFPPQAIDGPDRFRLVLRLMSTLGRRLRRAVTLVHGRDHLPLIGYRHGPGFTLLGMAA